MKYLKKSLAGRSPYYSKMITDGIILNANESPFDAPKEIMEEFKKEIDNLNLKRYPDTDNTVIREAIAKSYDIKIENVTCGVGSDQLLDCIFKSLLDKDDKIVACNPTFSMYREYSYYVNYNDDNFIDVDFIYDEDNGFLFNTEKIINTIIENDPKLVIICSPNNPTGSIISRDDLKRIIKATNGVVLIDEAYSDFYTESNYDLAVKNKNVIVLKTFSKAYALAGIRLGYAVSCADLIDTINVCKPPYNLSTISQKIAAIAISKKELYQPQIDRITQLKNDLFLSLKNLGLKPINSYSNFIFIRFENKIYEDLLNNKIYIRKLKYKSRTYYRINTGTEEENNRLIEEIRTSLESINIEKEARNDLIDKMNDASIQNKIAFDYIYFKYELNDLSNLNIHGVTVHKANGKKYNYYIYTRSKDGNRRFISYLCNEAGRNSCAVVKTDGKSYVKKVDTRKKDREKVIEKIHA